MKQKLWSQIRTQNGECGHKRINDEEKSEPLLKQIWFKNVDVKSKVTWEIHNLISTYNHPFIYNRKQWGAFQILFPGILCQSGSNAFIKIKKKKKKGEDIKTIVDSVRHRVWLNDPFTQNTICRRFLHDDDISSVKYYVESFKIKIKTAFTPWKLIMCQALLQILSRIIH